MQHSEEGRFAVTRNSSSVEPSDIRVCECVGVCDERARTKERKSCAAVVTIAQGGDVELFFSRIP